MWTVEIYKTVNTLYIQTKFCMFSWSQNAEAVHIVMYDCIFSSSKLYTTYRFFSWKLGIIAGRLTKDRTFIYTPLENLVYNYWYINKS